MSVHFVNNVLAAAASYIEVEPERARDVLVDLGAFLSHRLRGAREVPLVQEMDHVGAYLRLEQARFPERIAIELPGTSSLPMARVVAGTVQAPLAEALGRWLNEHRGALRLAMRVRSDGTTVEAQLDQPENPAAPGERVRIPLHDETVTGNAA